MEKALTHAAEEAKVQGTLEVCQFFQTFTYIDTKYLYSTNKNVLKYIINTRANILCKYIGY